MNPVTAFQSLDRIRKWGILVVLTGVMVAIGYKVYQKYQLRLAHENEIIANQLREEGKAAKQDALKYKAEAEELKTKLGKANGKIAKLRSEVDAVKVPDAPVAPPANLGETLAGLKGMGLSLVQKPSTAVFPSVAGITADDAGKIWMWGKEAERGPSLELKLNKTNELVAGLTKAKTLAEQMAEAREKEAEAALKSADKHEQEANALRSVVTETKRALAAERKKKLLYAVGAFGLGYVASKR